MKKTGFTFIELIIAIFVFLIGVLGVFLIAQNFISTTQISVSRLTASFLAQEGIEIVRNIRDENWLNLKKWDCNLVFNQPAGFMGCSSYNNFFCESDYNGYQTGENLMSFSDTVPPTPLNIEAANGFFGYGAGSPTRFTRKITIECIPDCTDPEYLEATVLIEWEEKGNLYQVQAQENLYPWWSEAGSCQ